MPYIERYGAHLDGGRFAAMYFTADVKEIHDVRNGCWVMLQWVCGSNSDGIWAHAVQQIHLVLTGTPTIPLFGVSRNLGISNVLMTSWNCFW